MPIFNKGRFRWAVVASRRNAKIEGVRRILVVGKLIILIGVTLGAIAWRFLGISPIIALVIPFYVVAVGGVVWAVGWIMQGFVQPDRENRSPDEEPQLSEPVNKR